MKNMVLFILLVLFLSLNGFALKLRMKPHFNDYSKVFDRLTLGLGMDIFFGKFNGFYIEYSYNTTLGYSSGSELSYPKPPFLYRGIHLTAGMKWQLTLIRSSKLSELTVYAKGGGRYIRGYSKTYEEERSANGSGLTAGGGLNFWFKNNGVGLEVMKNFSGRAKGFMDNESVFNGLMFTLRGMWRF